MTVDVPPGPESLIERARTTAGLSGAELARRAGTSRPTLAAYEHGAKSPTLLTAARILEAAGFELEIHRKPVFRHRGDYRGRPIMVPDSLPRLPVAQAVASVRLPLHLNWSKPNRIYNLARRRDRMRLYEIVLREGMPSDIVVYIDGAFLIDAWDDLVLPSPLRTAWQEFIDASA